jgi:hypothetical protein
MVLSKFEPEPLVILCRMVDETVKIIRRVPKSPHANPSFSTRDPEILLLF